MTVADLKQYEGQIVQIAFRVPQQGVRVSRVIWKILEVEKNGRQSGFVRVLKLTETGTNLPLPPANRREEEFSVRSIEYVKPARLPSGPASAHPTKK
jgi:hypothetical protein